MTGKDWTTAQLLEHAHSNGYPDLTGRRIEDWRARSLLPRPRRTGQNGVSPVWVSPPEAAAQLLDLCELHQRTRNTEQLRVLLWLRGHPQPADAIREAVVTALDDAKRTIDAELMKVAHKEGLSGDLGEVRRQAMPQLANWVASRRGTHAMPPRVRSGRTHRADGVAALLHTMYFGEVPPSEVGSAEAVERTLGLLPRGRIDTVKSTGPDGVTRRTGPWHDGVPTPLDVHARIASLPALRQAAQNVTDDDLRLARTITAPLVNGLAEIAKASSALHNWDQALGFGIVATIKFEGHEGPLLALVISLLQNDERRNLLLIHEATQIAVRQLSVLRAVLSRGARLSQSVDGITRQRINRLTQLLSPRSESPRSQPKAHQ